MGSGGLFVSVRLVERLDHKSGVEDGV